ncbi:MAG: hypothetical protein AB1721_02605 [Patescibacteria group bacterium]
MNTATQFLIILLSSGVVAAVTAAVMQKRNEKESRLFNAKLEAYKEFAAHLESKFVSLAREGKNLDITTLTEVSAKCLLVSNSNVNRELRAFLVYVSEVYQKCLYNTEQDSDFKKLWRDADKIEGLMRQDLEFK